MVHKIGTLRGINKHGYEQAETQAQFKAAIAVYRKDMATVREDGRMCHIRVEDPITNVSRDSLYRKLSAEKKSPTLID